MMKKSPKIIFFGNERLATGVTTECKTFQALVDNGYDVAALVLHNMAATSRKQRPVEIAARAAAHNIPVLTPHKLADIAPQLQALDPAIGVLVAFGKIIPQAIIDLFPSGIINIHPSKLPRHRGPTPLESVLLSGESETAVSIMQLVQAMDAGPVYAQQTVGVQPGITKQAFADQISEIGAAMIIDALPTILDGQLQPVPQNEAEATYDQLISKQDSVLDWQQPAAALERQIRAYAGWPKSTAQLGGHQLIIAAAEVIPETGPAGTFRADKKSLTVFCGQDALAITIVQPAGKKEMPIQAFLTGYQLQ